LFLLDSDADAGFTHSPTLAAWLDIARRQLPAFG
jgi:hypothetical protein